MQTRGEYHRNKKLLLNLIIYFDNLSKRVAKRMILLFIPKLIVYSITLVRRP